MLLCWKFYVAKVKGEYLLNRREANSLAGQANPNC